jgi:prepilin-type N-terminal cleavage/methylation domain-containing protein
MRRGFTLIEMLVVIGIIAVLVALLVPAAAIAVSSARNTTMSIEIAELGKAIERYKQEKGDYPPSMGEIDVNDLDGDNNFNESMYQANLVYLSICEKHLQTCYPKMTNQEKQFFYTNIAPNLSGDEALVFWLSLTQTDERNPFTSAAKNFKRYYPFAEDRLEDFDGDTFPSYKPRYAKLTPFVYIDARHYLSHQYAATAIGETVQPYGDYAKYQSLQNQPVPSPLTLAIVNQRKQSQYMNPTTFQIISAGQDGDFGQPWDQFTANGLAREDFSVTPNQGMKMFPAGTIYTSDDKDNLASFSAGKRLLDHLP